MALEHTTAWLLARMRDGDAAARNALYARLEPQLRRWARGRVPAPARLRDGQDTADFVQSALLRSLSRLDVFESKHPGALYAYLRTTLLNVMRDALRALPATERIEFEALEAMPAMPDSMLVAAFGRDAVLAYEQLLQRLAAEHRELILMRFEFGMSYVEIAEATGETPDGVRMKLNRALRRMAALAAGV